MLDVLIAVAIRAGRTVLDVYRRRCWASCTRRSPASPGPARAVRLGELRAMGSAGLKGAAVARAAADVYLDPGAQTKRWDACAIDALVTAAGGRFTDLAGAPLDYRAPGLTNERGLLATKGCLHDAEIREILASAPRRRFARLLLAG